MNLTRRFHVGLAHSWHFHGVFFLSLSRHFHVTFMASPNMAKGESAKKSLWIDHETADSSQIHGTFNQTERQTAKIHSKFIAFSSNVQFFVVVGFIMFVSVYLSIVLFIFCFYFHWLFSKLIKVVVFFPSSKYGVIISTHTTKPNPLLGVI